MILPGIFSQRDPRWANNELGYNNDPYFNVYHFGCLVTAVSNVMWDAGYGPDPGAVNQWLKDQHGFEEGGGNMIWEVAHRLMTQANLTYVGYTSDRNQLNDFLQADNNFAIAQLTKPGFPMHFSAMPYVDQITDSWDATLKPLSSYNFVNAHLYTKTLPAPVVAAPTITVAAPTIVAPQPDPVPSVETPISPPEEPVQPVTTPDQNVQVTGQPSGDIEPTIHENNDLLAPLGLQVDEEPTEPEYVRSYQPFNGYQHKTLQREAFAKDLTGDGGPVAFKKGALTRLAGELTYEGKKYYRGATSADQGGWYCIESEAYDNNFEVSFLGALEETKAVFAKAQRFDPIAAILRWLGRKNKS